MLMIKKSHITNCCVLSKKNKVFLMIEKSNLILFPIRLSFKTKVSLLARKGT